MEYTEQQENEFYALRDEAAAQLSKQTLKDNSNVTYGQLLSPKELQLATHMYSPEVKARASQIYTPEEITRIETAVNWEKRVAPYNRAPVDYDMYERHPEYQKRLDSYNEFQNDPMNQLSPDMSFNILDQREIDKRSEPFKPFGLDKSKEIASLGFDPSPDNQIQFENSDDQGRFNRMVALNPRNMTIGNYKNIGEQIGLKGEYVYINPSKPSLGIAFKAEGEEDFRVINSPQITADDTVQFLAQEFPAIAGDIAATIYGGKKFGFGKTGPLGGIVSKTAKVLGLSGASAIGAAGGDYVRLLAGKKLGYHDLDEIEMLKEAGVIGAWAFGGTAAITVSSRALTKLYKGIFNKDAPDVIYEAIDDALQASRNADSGLYTSPGMLYGDDVSVQQVRNQINELTDKYAADFGKDGYNPTFTSEAGTTGAADLEAIFLKNADDPKLKELYKQLKDGNQEVIDEFVRVLNEKIGPSTAGLDDATGATLSEGLRVMAQKDIDLFDDQAYDMINQVRRQVGGADDASVAGEVLLKQVDNSAASSGPIFERTQTRLNEIRKQYVEPFNDAWTSALNNPRYTNLKTGAGYTRAPAQKWLNARKGEAGQLLRRADGDEAVRELYNLIPAGSRNTIKRLTGKGKGGKFESPSFTINELNSARVALNEFASNLPDGKGGIAKLARSLERGLEDQMNLLVREGASVESGIPMSQKATLTDWINQNQYGDDLRKAWSNQREALELSNGQAIRSLMQQNRPEKVAEYMFNTVAKGSKQNKPMTDLMTVLKTNGSDEVLQIQEGLAAYIQREVLSDPDLSAMAIAKKYRQFVKDNEGTLRAVFGDKQFASRFYNKRGFDKVIKGLEKTNEDILKIQARFGMVNAGEPDKVMTNIVESILATGKTQKQSGRVLEDIEYLASIIKDNPELSEQVAQVTKRYLMQDIITSKQGGGFAVDAAGLDRLLKEGFGPEQVTGPRLTFDSFMTPLLGKKDGKAFVKNLKILNTVVQREIGAAPSESVAGALAKGEYGPGANIEGARMLMRLLIPPLTQTGRRATAVTNRQAENSRKFIGQMLLDPELFERTMKFAQGREKTQRFISFLTSYNMVVANDLGNEMKYYDTTDKKQKTPENVSTTERVQMLNSDIPSRIIEMGGAI